MSMLAPIDMATDDIRKLFPQLYYQKYAKHIKIRHFEQQMIDDDIKRLYQQNNRASDVQQSKIRQLIPKQLQSRVKITKYDSFIETIQKNKTELRRMNRYNTVLGLKLQVSPDRRNVLRSPSKNEVELREDVLLRLQAIEDDEYHSKDAMRASQRLRLQKEAICCFIKNTKSVNSSPRKMASEGPLINTNPETSRPMLNLSKMSRLYAQPNSSQSQPRLRHTSTSNRKPSTLNSPLLRKTKKRLTSRSVNKASTEKRDLIEATRELRDQVKSMATLKMYDVAMWKKTVRTNLERLE